MKGYSFRSLTDLVLKIFKTEVNAGTGLSGGGSLEADRTLAVKYGTDAGTAAQGNDSRLSNSREWSSATISQAETEAGTATTRRAFTAQRVRQAIVAWFNGISGSLGRTILTRTTAAQVRSDIGLGTAATRNVGTASGNVLQVGAFGVGAAATSGGFRSYVLPHMSFGGGGVSDEWLVLFPYNTTAPHGVLGEIRTSRGNTSAGNTISVERIQAQAAYGTTTCLSVCDGNRRFLRFGILTIDNAQYLALKGDISGGDAGNTFTFHGTVVGGDSKLFTRVRESDGNVTVTTPDVGGVEQGYHTGNLPTTATRWPTFAEVTGKPSTFPPSSHTHPVSQVTGLGDSATRNVGTSSGQVMQVGAGGWLGRASENGYMSGYPTNSSQSISQIYRRTSGDGPVLSYATSIHFASVDTWGRLRISHNKPRAWIQGGLSSTGSGWTEELYHTGNLPTTATRWPTWAEVTGKPAIYTPIGVGQTWQVVTSSRTYNTNYTNTTGRPISVSVNLVSDKPKVSLLVGGVEIDSNWESYKYAGGTDFSMQAIVPAGAVYRVDGIPHEGKFNYWVELR